MTTIAISASAPSEWFEQLSVAVAGIIESAQAAKQVLQVAVTREKAVIRTYMALRGLNKQLDTMFDSVDQGILDLQSGTVDFIDVQEDTNAKDVTSLLRRGYIVLKALYTLYTLAGLRKKKLTSSQVIKLDLAAERLLDLLMWIEDATSSTERQHAEESFAIGLHELEQGETVALF